MKHLQLPSRGRCRYLWTLDDYQGIAENFESNVLTENCSSRALESLISNPFI